MRLRVLSFNVWGLPPPVGRDVEERLTLVLRDLRDLDCDLLLFQEVWTEEARAQLLAGGRDLGYTHSWTRGAARGGSGLLALSRLPIRAAHFRRFTLCGLPQRITQMDYYSGKGVARLDVATPSGQVAVFNTHLHARYAPATMQDEYVGHRTAEVIEFADELRQVSDPVIAAGDFNMRDISPEYALLRDLTGVTDAAVALDNREPTATLDNSYRAARGAVSESRIDYVFCRSGVDRGVRATSVRRVFDAPVLVAGGPGAYSDHAGVVADVELDQDPEEHRPVPAIVFDRARALLGEGRERTLTRRRNERLSAAGGVIVGGLAVAAARRPALSRRRFLRAATWGLAGLSTATAAGLLTLAERFVPEELGGYDSTEALLTRMAEAASTARP